MGMENDKAGAIRVGRGLGEMVTAPRRDADQVGVTGPGSQHGCVEQRKFGLNPCT